MKIISGIFFGVAAIINLILAVIAISFQMSVIHLLIAILYALLIAILYASSAVCMLIAAKGE